MEYKTIKKIMGFLKEKENKLSLKWKLINNEPLTEEELDVKGDLDLSDMNITSLPEGLKVGGYLRLNNCKSLTSLPEGLKVLNSNGNLYLENCTSLTSLPKGLKVGGYLYVINTPLAKHTNKTLLKMIGDEGYIRLGIMRL